MPETTLDLLIGCADPACGLRFIPRKPWHKYHSARCRTRHWERLHRRRAESAAGLTCPSCGAHLALTLERALYPPKPSA